LPDGFVQARVTVVPLTVAVRLHGAAGAEVDEDEDAQDVDDPLVDEPLEEDPLEEDPLDDDPLDEDPLDDDPLDEDPLDDPSKACWKEASELGKLPSVMESIWPVSSKLK
jgi:hypothetical protein